MTAPLLTLSDDLLFEILRYVGSGNVWNLRPVALTCRRLASLVYGDDQTLWRELHAEAYDNPFEAVAFLKPRTEYPWRTTVIERNVVARYLKESILNEFASGSLGFRQYEEDQGFPYCRPYMPPDADCGEHDDYVRPRPMTEEAYQLVKEEALRWAPRVFRVFNGLYVDMSKQGGVCSRNAALIDDRTLWSNVIRILLGVVLPPRLEYGHDGMETMPGPLSPHSEATRFVAMAISMGYLDPDRVYKRQPTRRDWRRPMGRLIDWQGCMRNAWFHRHPAMPHQGAGLLNLPPRPHGHAVWDWAEVEGEWLAFHAGRLIAHHPPAVLSPLILNQSSYLYHREHEVDRDFPASFRAVPASTRIEVDRAFAQMSTAAVDLWYQFPADPGPRSEIPTLYFHGTSTDNTTPSFVYGMVCLTQNEPPEKEWIFAVHHFGSGQQVDNTTRREDFVMRGIEMSWEGYSIGVQGSYGPRSWGPRSQLYSSSASVERDETLVTPDTDDGFHSYGPAHFFKTSHVPDDLIETYRDDARSPDRRWGLNSWEPLVFGINRSVAGGSFTDNWYFDEVDHSHWVPSLLEADDGNALMSSDSEEEPSTI